MSFLDSIFDPVLGPLLNIPLFFTLLIICAVLTFIITIVYKYTTNQSEMKQIKDDLKRYQKEMKETKDPKKMMATQKKALDLNMKYMMSSFKSTLYTFIPILIIFAWLSGHIAYHPLLPGEDFSVTAQFGEGAKGNITLAAMPSLNIDSPVKGIADNEAVWILNGAEGSYKLTFDYNTEQYEKTILITTAHTYETPETPIKDSKLKMIVIGNKKVHPFGESFNIFGWYPGWLATYILLSLVFSSLFRKLLKVY
jgi:uncharacterized membrane protein (DUF106 family)